MSLRVEDINSAETLIKYHEGLTLVAVRDTRGWSIGYGHDGASQGQTCTIDEAEAWFSADYATALRVAILDYSRAAWATLAPPRQAVLVDMAYELGGLGLSGFVKMLSAMRAGDWATAKAELLCSLLASQVPNREAMNASIIESGLWPGASPIVPTIA